MSLILTIYTMMHCPTCDETRRTVAEVSRRFPELEVDVVNLEDPSVDAPPEVFSVPTYMLNGDVISLGNPYIEQLEAAIRRHIPAS